ncbi:MAG: hypothetical protein AVDCRST_MAG59-3838 [uncultured Thermomicrobiales bacterium]|uniref:Uncharacterized protein n=1 Tax=uncultured Thermomicrobiales bacterium TaxID=1645740 RepID=A0A6J4VAQ6_9BACT|nr:MAG: hypothetical protein AVDCRST_MAG59-3838 [uncultured Thermomicrobiales bacterium]
MRSTERSPVASPTPTATAPKVRTSTEVPSVWTTAELPVAGSVGSSTHRHAPAVGCLVMDAPSRAVTEPKFRPDPAPGRTAAVVASGIQGRRVVHPSFCC